MCGRLNITDDPSVKSLCKSLGFNFNPFPSDDVRPTQTLATIAFTGSEYTQLNTTWGIKPSWSTRLLINAKAETVDTKKTFKLAFQNNRCLVPCHGWFEWKDEGGTRKQKYLFTHANKQPVYMAGIYYEPSHELVTLTTRPNEKCAHYHTRMPVIVEPDAISWWLTSNATQLQSLLEPVDNSMIEVSKC